MLIKGKFQKEEIIIISIFGPSTSTLHYIKQIPMDMKNQATNHWHKCNGRPQYLTVTNREIKQTKILERNIRNIPNLWANRLSRLFGLLSSIPKHRNTHSSQLYKGWSTKYSYNSSINMLKCMQSNWNWYTCILSDNNTMELQINGKRNDKNCINSKLNTLLKNEWVKDEMKKN